MAEDEGLAPIEPPAGRKKAGKKKQAKADTGSGKKAKRGQQTGAAPASGQSFRFTLSDEMLEPATGAVVSFLITRAASKSVAVNVAVTNQLVRDRKWPPNDLTKVMGAIPYRYDSRSMRNFLKGVETTLAAALPPFTFDWNGAFVTKSLGLTVAALMGEIELKTT